MAGNDGTVATEEQWVREQIHRPILPVWCIHTSKYTLDTSCIMFLVI